jgi:hypothetical protein
MALLHVTRKAKRQVVVFLLLEGGGFQEYIEGKAILRGTHKSTVLMTKEQLEGGVQVVDPTLYTVPSVQFPQARWVPAWGLLACETFNTPSEDLEPGTYNNEGGRVAFLDEAGVYQEESAANVTITRGAANEVLSIQKRGGLP